MISMLKSYGKAARTVAVVLLVVAVAGAAARQARLLDRHFIFFPDRDLGATPAEVGLHYEDVRLGVGTGEEIHGWFVPGDSETTLLWLHGNAGNIGGRLDNLRMLHDALGLSVLIFDYRGYGQSGGVPSEAAMYEDAEAALEFLRSDKGLDPVESIVLFGRSLGGAVAVETAARRSVRGVVLESAFTSIRDMARRTHPYLPSSLVMRMIESRFDALSRIPDVRSPVLIRPRRPGRPGPCRPCTAAVRRGGRTEEPLPDRGRVPQRHLPGRRRILLRRPPRLHRQPERSRIRDRQGHTTH